MNDGLYAVAVHEAGHLALMLGLGVPVESASVVPDDRTAGRVEPSPLPAPPSSAPPLTVGEQAMLSAGLAVVVVAGEVAVEVAGFEADGLGLDHEQFDATADVVSNLLGVEPRSWRGVARQAAERYLRENWSVVMRVVGVLLTEGTITGERAREVAGDLPYPDLKALAGSLTFWAGRAARPAPVSAAPSRG
jgi:hypothetical protein